jgi:hypothetical protein
MADNAVTTAEIGKYLSVDEFKLASNSVTTNKITRILIHKCKIKY